MSPLTPSLHQLAVEALDSRACLCGAKKDRGNSFCHGCYFALPKEMRNALYRALRDGYAEAWDEARDWLRINTTRLQRQEPLFTPEKPEAKP
jgi:hypothetical protein